MRFHSLRCRASLSFLVWRAWPLAVPRMEHAAARLPFSARHARVASAATANVLSVFPLKFLSPCISMSSATFWSDACRNARHRPLPTLLNAVYASCGVTVRRPPLLPLGACPAYVCVAGCLVCM